MGISTHILDITSGRPAVGVGVTLEIMSDGRWTEMRTTATDENGRCTQLLPEGRDLVTGMYRISFRTSAYYESQRTNGLYPLVDVTFTVTDADQHYHIPLLLTANGYTTYRGS